MARPGRGEAERSPRHETGRRLGAVRSQPARTTKPRREPAIQSRSPRRAAPRRQVAPLVRFFSRVLVIGGITRVDRGGSMTSQQRLQRLIDQSRVGDPRTHAAGAAEKLRIHRRAQTYAIHTIIMPLATSGSAKQRGRAALVRDAGCGLRHGDSRRGGMARVAGRRAHRHSTLRVTAVAVGR